MVDPPSCVEAGGCGHIAEVSQGASTYYKDGPNNDSIAPVLACKVTTNDTHTVTALGETRGGPTINKYPRADAGSLQVQSKRSHRPCTGSMRSPLWLKQREKDGESWQMTLPVP